MTLHPKGFSTQLALDWRIEGFYARYIDAQGKCRAMVRVEPEAEPIIEQEAIKEART